MDGISSVVRRRLLDDINPYYRSSRSPISSPIYLWTSDLEIFDESGLPGIFESGSEGDEAVVLLLQLFLLSGLVSSGTYLQADGTVIQGGEVVKYQLAVDKVLRHFADGSISFLLGLFSCRHEYIQLADHVEAVPGLGKRATKAIGNLDMGSHPTRSFGVYGAGLFYAI